MTLRKISKRKRIYFSNIARNSEGLTLQFSCVFVTFKMKIDNYGKISKVRTLGERYRELLSSLVRIIRCSMLDDCISVLYAKIL